MAVLAGPPAIGTRTLRASSPTVGSRVIPPTSLVPLSLTLTEKARKPASAVGKSRSGGAAEPGLRLPRPCRQGPPARPPPSAREPGQPGTAASETQPGPARPCPALPRRALTAAAASPCSAGPAPGARGRSRRGRATKGALSLPEPGRSAHLVALGQKCIAFPVIPFLEAAFQMSVT